MFQKLSNKAKLFNIIEKNHFEGSRLCNQVFGRYLPNAGNMGVFCHYDDEYQMLTQIKNELTEPSENAAQKYFKLKQPIAIPAKGDAPQTTYTYLYIRKPDPTPYGQHTGDVDFYLPDNEFVSLIDSIQKGKTIEFAQLYNQSGETMIELSTPDTLALAYVSTKSTAEKVRVKF